MSEKAEDRVEAVRHALGGLLDRLAALVAEGLSRPVRRDATVERPVAGSNDDPPGTRRS